MLAVLIYLVAVVRHLVHTASIVADSFHEAQEMRRAMPTIYIEE
jgi:hypothetical protein